MYFANYNDYELIYLVNEGSERALNVLYQKYNIYIYKVAGKFVSRSELKEDLVQEGLMLLNQSIKKFNPRFTASFYTYFSVVLKRGFLRLMNNGYYKSRYYVDTELIFSEPDYTENNFNVNLLKRYLNAELDVEVYEDCILGNLSVATFAQIHKVDYNEVYRRKKAIIRRLKNVLTNL